jgi:hypothetical protein
VDNDTLVEPEHAQEEVVRDTDTTTSDDFPTPPPLLPDEIVPFATVLPSRFEELFPEFGVRDDQQPTLVGTLGTHNRTIPKFCVQRVFFIHTIFLIQVYT